VFDIVELISQTVTLPREFVNKFLWRPTRSPQCSAGTNATGGYLFAAPSISQAAMV
jgi:hypothetical protein